MDEIAETEKDLKAAQVEQRKYFKGLEDQYTPKIEVLRKKIVETEKQIEMLAVLQDPTRSPAAHLKTEIDRLDENLALLEKQLSEVETLFKEVLVYFKKPEDHHILSNDQSCELSSVKRNAIVDLQGEKGSDGIRMWILKQYEARCRDKLLRSHWLISQVK